MSWNSKVIWSEGMFLLPQHLQQHDRYLERLIEGRTQPIAAYSWGYTHLVVDEAALTLGKISIAAARGILPDGTPFDFPSLDLAPLPLDIPADAKDQIVVLALPLRRAGSLETDLQGVDDSRLTRYTASTLEVADNTINADQPGAVQVGDLRLTLMLKREATDAYGTLGVVRISERRADNQLLTDKNYIPPTLAVRSSNLLAGYVRELQGLLHQRGEALSAHLAQPGRGGVAEIADFLLLQTVNRYEAVFAHLDAVSNLHPERLFVTCLMLAGDLATFSRENRRPPNYPHYVHDEPERCFGPLMADLRRSLSMDPVTRAIPIELQERRYGVRVAIVPDLELLRNASFVLAVNAQMPGEALRLRFPTQVRVGPVERIRDLVNLQLPGIVLRPLPVAPRQIPYHAGFNYFDLARGGELWTQLQQSGGLAMHIAGEFPGLELELWAIRD